MKIDVKMKYFRLDRTARINLYFFKSNQFYMDLKVISCRIKSSLSQVNPNARTSYKLMKFQPSSNTNPGLFVPCWAL